MDSNVLKCAARYYLREKCFAKVYNLMTKAVAKQFDAHFYASIALILEGQTQNGIRDILALQDDPNLQTAVLIALIYAHKKSSSYERDLVMSLEAKLKESRKQANHISLYYAALFLSLAEKYEKSVEYLSRAIKKDPNFTDAIVLKAWNSLLINESECDSSIYDTLEWVTHKTGFHIEAVLGCAKYNYMTMNFPASNLLLDQIIVKYPDEVFPLMEKLRNEFALKKWDVVQDIIERVFVMDFSLEAHKVKIYIVLGRNGDSIEASDLLNSCYAFLEKNEPQNSVQFYTVAKLFSRICDRSSSILAQTYRFAQYASEVQPNNVEYLTEVGFQCFLQGKAREAQVFFKAATKIDSDYIIALCGLTACQIKENGINKQVNEQLELLMETQGTKYNPRIFLLSAMAAENAEHAISLLDKAVELQFETVRKTPLSLNYILNIDPDLLFDAFKEYQKYLPNKPFIITDELRFIHDTSNNIFNKCMKILESIVSACPGILRAVFELAKLSFSYGLLDEAQKLCDNILDINSMHSGVHILLAQLNLQRKNFDKGLLCLESCVSYNFKMNDNPMYYLTHGILMKQKNRNEEALTSLKTCLDLINKPSKHGKTVEAICIVDKATLYLELISLYNTMMQKTESEKLMQEAIQTFTFTSENTRITILKAEQALKAQDPDQALELLSEVKADEPYYLQARTKMAQIYLKVKNNKSMFKSCFRDIVSNTANNDAQVMMGDAYMDVCEPVNAVECYRTALKSNPNNIDLIKKLGHSLFKSHEFALLMEHYESCMERLPENIELKCQYYDVLIKLKQYKKLDKLIEMELKKIEENNENLETMQRKVKLILMQVEVWEHLDDLKDTFALLNTVRKLQTTIVRQIEINGKGILEDEKQRLCQILCSMATSRSCKDPISLYTEALSNLPRDTKILMALAKLYAQTNNTDKCEQTCSILFLADPNNESAAVMMADLAFRRVDFDAAQKHLETILSSNTMSYEALSQLIEVAYRRGKLSDVEPFLENAKDASSKNLASGYWYAAGMWALYSRKPNTALRNLNLARNDEKWRNAAAKVMVLICLNHGNDGSEPIEQFMGSDSGETRTLAMRTAERLVVDTSSEARRPLSALIRLASDHKIHAEAVLQELGTAEWEDEPYAVLALSISLNQLKQTSRAKTILKRAFSSIPWSPDKADGLERCWLELAQMLAPNSSKADTVKEIIAKILKHNAASVEAHSIAGQLAEKEQNYKAAVHSYESAWIHGGKQDLSVGFKYAYVSLKQRKYPQTIAVCKQILTVNPDFPKVRRDILDKAISNLRI